ncbi:hypothetical protein [Methylobacterium terrae]|uniref:hypothetical protein n=1 Tax=Methylobacterium terrae TaxID=2202827 RepID=UPI0013A541C2|nr:hypothetical protein [Methylobacterium terrae]
MALDGRNPSCIFYRHEAGMAFFNDLTRAIAQVEGMDEATVRGIGISVRDHGHIKKGGRGLSAAKMSATDACNLLIGVNASSSIRDAGSLVESYRSAILTDRMGLKTTQKGDLHEIFQLNAPFGVVFEKLIDAATVEEEGINKLSAYIVDGIAYPQGGAIRSDLVKSVFETLIVEFVFNKPNPMIDIYFRAMGSNNIFAQFWFSGHSNSNQSDRADTTKITHKTIMAVASVIKD